MPQKKNPVARSSVRPEFVITPMLMKATEAAPYCGLNLYDLYRRTAAGEIRGITWGKNARNLRWRKSDLDSWIDSLPVSNGPVRSKPRRRPVPEPAA
jgi:hypothetical protein